MLRERVCESYIATQPVIDGGGGGASSCVCVCVVSHPEFLHLVCGCSLRLVLASSAPYLQFTIYNLLGYKCSISKISKHTLEILEIQHFQELGKLLRAASGSWKFASGRLRRPGNLGVPQTALLWKSQPSEISFRRPRRQKSGNAAGFF